MKEYKWAKNGYVKRDEWHDHALTLGYALFWYAVALAVFTFPFLVALKK